MIRLRYPNLMHGCIGYWSPSQDRAGTTTVMDLSNSRNNLIMTNMDAATDRTNVTDKKAIDLDGTNDRMSGQSFSLSGTISVAMWVYLRSLADEMLINLKPTNTTFNVFFFGSVLNLRGGSVTSVTYTPSGVLNRWAHIGATIRGTTGTLFLDGNQVATGTVTAIGTPTGLDVGAYSDFGAGYFVNGAYAEIGAWSRLIGHDEFKLLASRVGVPLETVNVRRGRIPVAVAGNRRRRMILGAA